MGTSQIEFTAKTIYFAAIDLVDGKERSQYVEQACNGSGELRSEVEQLLSAHDGECSNLFSRAVNHLNSRATQESQGEEDSPAVKCGQFDPSTHPMIDRYKVLEEIARGGMGTVYLAQQTEPIRRRVALKLINPGMDSREVIARFEAERQALAMMDHPNIARVLDAGTTEGGRPYFVMELVKGQPITDYCQQQHLELEERLGLFNDVCQAVQHAHQKGIIHRDLKPSNVMVCSHDGVPVVKVIDFGVAKALHQDLTDKTLFTQFSQLVGTPLYMSPEQAGQSSLDVDTRSDIYSLGVLLYELLTDTTPFDREELLEAGFDQARQIICQREPLRPSVRLSTLKAADDSTLKAPAPQETKRLAFKLRGELDWIVMKALEKDRQRRYESASALAQDVERYLHNEPIEAKPPTLSNWLVKWSRRHVAAVWALVIGSLTLATALGISTAAITVSRNTAEQERGQAELERQQAEQQRQVAVEQRKVARKNQYFAEMVAGQIQTDSGNAGGLYNNLIKYLPLPQAHDLRDWEWYYLLSKCRPEERTITHPFSTPFAAWSPDGKFIAAPGAVWEADTGTCIRRFDTSYIKRGRVAWRPDGRRFAWAVVDDENAFYVWDRSAEKVSRFAGHESSAWCVAWSPDGSQIASGSTDKTIRIWDIASESLLWSVSTPHYVMNIDWSADGRFLAAGLHYFGVQVWDVSSRQPVTEQTAPGNHHDVSWHPEGDFLAVCDESRWYVLKREDWSVVQEKEISRGRAISYSPDGSQIAVAHGEIVTLWSSNGQEQIQQLIGHREPVMSVSWSSDGRRLVTGDYSREIKLWDLDQGARAAPIDVGAKISALEWLPDNATLLTVAQEDGSSAWWDASSGSVQHREELALEPPFELSPDRRLAAIHKEQDHTLQIHDTSNGSIISLLPLDPSREFYSCKFALNGSRVVIQTKTKAALFIEVWDVDQEHLLWSWEKNGAKTASGGIVTPPLSPLRWSDDGTRIAGVGLGDEGENGSTFWDDHLHVFDAVKGTRLFRHLVAAGREAVTVIAWSPNDKFVAIGALDGSLEVVNVEKGRRTFAKKIHPKSISSIAWHPIGNRLAVGTRDGIVKLVTADEGNVLLSLSRPKTHKVQELAWSDNGQRLAAACSDAQIHVWDATTAYDISEKGLRRGELACAYLDLAAGAPVEMNQAALGEFVRHAPDDLGFWEMRGSAYAQLGDYQHAVEEFSKGVGSIITQAFGPARSRAYALLGDGRDGEYHEACAQLVEEFSDSPVPSNQGYVSWLCALTPNQLIDSEKVLRMARLNRAEYEGDASHLTYGACLYRKGELDEAVRVLMDFTDRLDRGGDLMDRYHTASAKYFLSMSRLSLDHKFQAERLLDEANDLADAYLERVPGRYWQRIVALRTLRQEATAAIAD